jgi:hypothetical protein
MAKTITPNTPIKLDESVCGPFSEAYNEMIEEHGAAYAVNFVLAHHLRRRGHNIAELKTPSEKIAAGQTRRWQSVKGVLEEAQSDLERRREMKRERDRRYREKKKAAKTAQSSAPEE